MTFQFNPSNFKLTRNTAWDGGKDLANSYPALKARRQALRAEDRVGAPSRAHELGGRMGVCILRHAKAEKKGNWSISDRLRPLTSYGLHQ